MKNIFTTAVILFTFFLQSRISSAQPGSLDPMFADNGISTLYHNFANEESRDVALTNNGKILTVTGAGSDFSSNYLTRFLSNGTPDSSFGINANLNILIDENVSVTALSVDPFNRILIMAEGDEYYNAGVFLYRLFADGSEDLSFGNNGRAKAKFMTANNALITQPDGKIVVAGKNYDKARVERFNVDGTIDTTFNTIGYISLGPGQDNDAFSIALDANNNYLVSGWSDGDLILYRLLSNGTPDNTFSGTGYTLVDNGGTEAGQSVAVMPGGEIVVTGFSETHFASGMNCWRFLQDGSADISFGNNGIVQVDSGAYFNFGWFLFPNVDSTLVIGGSLYNGSTNDPYLFKLNYNGTMDAGFGNNGMTGKTFTSGKSIEINAVKTADGNFLMCGTKVRNGDNLTALSRFLPDGSTDASFGANGIATLQILDSTYSNVQVNDFAVLPDGNILCAASSSIAGLTLYRLSPDGVMDNSYGQNGWLVPDVEQLNLYHSIATGENEIYIVTNGEQYFYDLLTPGYSSNDHAKYSVIKLHTDGTIDPTYGVSGIALHNFPVNMINGFKSIAVQPDGKLLLTGSLYINYGGIYGADEDAFIIRFNQDGSADSSFGDQGMMTIDLSWRDVLATVSVLADGKIIFAETALDTIPGNSVNKMLRLMPDGSLDPSFGINGISNLGYTGMLHDIPIIFQPDNKMILTLSTFDYQAHYALERINVNGSIDNTFGAGGFSNAPHDAQFQTLTSVQLQSDGSILCLGKTPFTNFYDHVSVLRLKNNGTIDSTFGILGVSNCDSSSNFIAGYAMHLQPDGKILVAGEKNINGYYVARLLQDIGTPIENVNPASSLLLFPNPVSDQLMIEHLLKLPENTTITVTNVLGKVVQQQAVNLTGDLFSVDVNAFSAGVYTLTLKTGKSVCSAKFVKE